MSGLLSFGAGFLLAGADLAGLWWFTRRLGRKLAGLERSLLVVFLLAKFALLALAVHWMSRRPWMSAVPLAAGLGLPFLVFFAVAALRQGREKGGGNVASG